MEYTPWQQRIYNELERRFKENNWMPITINMRDTGLPIELSVTSEKDINQLSDADYISATGPQSASWFDGTAEEIVTKLSNYHEIHTNWIRTFIEAKTYFKKHMLTHPAKHRANREEHWRAFEIMHNKIFGYNPVKNGMIFGEYFDYTAFIGGDTAKIS